LRDYVGSDVVEDCDYFIHGTTVGLNAVLERQGANLGLLCTEGFRDVLEIGRGDRGEMYNLFWRQPEALAPRNLRIPVRERTMADGTLHCGLVEEDVRAALKKFNANGVNSIAVALINAYANPSHELAVERILRSAGFDGEISLSHRVS